MKKLFLVIGLCIITSQLLALPYGHARFYIGKIACNHGKLLQEDGTEVVDFLLTGHTYICHYGYNGQSWQVQLPYVYLIEAKSESIIEGNNLIDYHALYYAPEEDANGNPIRINTMAATTEKLYLDYLPSLVEEDDNGQLIHYWPMVPDYGYNRVFLWMAITEKTVQDEKTKFTSPFAIILFQEDFS